MQIKKQTLKEQPQPKQKTNNHQEQKPKVYQKGNEAFGSKGKEKIVVDDDDDEELYKGEKLVRKKRYMELDHLLFLQRELEEKEAKDKISKVTLKSHKSLLWKGFRVKLSIIQAFLVGAFGIL